MALYRKYRSQNLDEIIGQEHVVRTLKNALAAGSVAHAYLFSGPRGTGKTSIARILAQELGAGELDTIEIDAASHRGIDEVRALREQVLFQPVSGDKKVYILDEVHMLTKEAFNALLKTLEEPPEFVHFVLCTTEPYKIPTTIISRTQRFDFRPGSHENVKQLIKTVAVAENQDIADDVIALIAKRADGGYRDALSLLEQILDLSPEGDEYLQQVHQALGIVMAAEVGDFTEAMLQKDTNRALEVVATLDSRQADFSHFIKEVLLSLRSYLMNEHDDYPKIEVKNAILLLTDAANEMKYAPVTALPLELAILEYTAIEKESMSTIPPMTSLNSLPNKEKKTTVQKANSNSSSLSGEVSWWPDVLEAIKPHNHTLEALLKGCTPGEITDGVLPLNFKYKFHKERIEEPENKAIVVQVIQEVSNQPLSVDCVLIERSGGDRAFHGGQSSEEVTIKPQKPKKQPGKNGNNTDTIQAEEMLKQALNDLGGKIITE